MRVLAAIFIDYYKVYKIFLMDVKRQMALLIMHNCNYTTVSS